MYGSETFRERAVGLRYAENPPLLPFLNPLRPANKPHTRTRANDTHRSPSRKKRRDCSCTPLRAAKAAKIFCILVVGFTCGWVRLLGCAWESVSQHAKRSKAAAEAPTPYLELHLLARLVPHCVCMGVYRFVIMVVVRVQGRRGAVGRYKPIPPSPHPNTAWWGEAAEARIDPTAWLQPALDLTGYSGRQQLQ